MKYVKFVSGETFITVVTDLGGTTFLADELNEYFVSFLAETGLTVDAVGKLEPNVWVTFSGGKN